MAAYRVRRPAAWSLMCGAACLLAHFPLRVPLELQEQQDQPQQQQQQCSDARLLFLVPSRTTRPQLPPAVNWHLEPRCNFACEFCFAHFYEAGKTPEVQHLELKVSFDLLQQLSEAGAQKLTFVGGEPLLHPHIHELVARAKELGLTTCIVTNGSMLNAGWLRRMRRHLDWLGISVDASSDALHLQIGRASLRDRRRNESSHLEHLEAMFKEARELGYGLKLNTVVSRPTLGDDMTDLVLRLKPDRWKAFQVLRIEGENEDKFEDYRITAREFEDWVQRHQRQLAPRNMQLVPERNEDMYGTYAMMDWKGRFYTNARGTHEYTQSAVHVGVQRAWEQVAMSFNAQGFSSRGGLWEW